MEIVVCLVVWVGHSLYAVYSSWSASKFHSENGDLWGGFFEPGWNLLGNRKKDTADFEWQVWMSHLKSRLFLSVAHCAVFNVLTEYLQPQFDWIILLPFWFCLHFYFYGIRIVGSTVGYGVLLAVIVWTKTTYLPSRKFVAQSLVWLTCVIILYILIVNSDSEFDNYEKAYVDAVLVAYKLLQFISFSLTKIGSGKGEGILWLLKEMFYYSFYWPYSIVLIVSYESFKSQLRERRTKRPSIAEIAVEGSRFVFWTVTTDFLRHFFYVTAFMNQPVLLEVLPLAVLCSVGYIAGQLFQLKYMAVFGLPRFFARLDCMQPPGLPICISRVSLYSRMWRYFDRGLYGFMKENIFVPVAAPSYSFIKRVSATTLSFGFVFLWHGASPAFLCWVSLNLVEIFAENAAKELAKLPRISSLISRYRPSTIRRVKAFLQIPCTSLGILAIFFFLGDNDGETGWVFIERIVLGEFLHFKFPLLCLIVLGYCYAQCCMEFEKMLT